MQNSLSVVFQDYTFFCERMAAMPKGFDTSLNKNFMEDGVEVSGGESQKIALARALYAALCVKPR